MSESPLAPHVATPTELQARLQLAARGDPFIVLRHPEGAQELVSLEGRVGLTIGRRAETDISLSWDPRVSRLHAELVRVGEDWVVTDDGLSANGTWLGDDRVFGRRRLRDGDLIRIGNTLIAFCAPLDSSDTTAMAGTASAAVEISPAQRRVLVALCRAFVISGTLVPPSNSELAAELFLSVESIKTHLKALFDAFDLSAVPPRQKRSALVERAVRTGVVREADARPSGA